MDLTVEVVSEQSTCSAVKPAWFELVALYKLISFSLPQSPHMRNGHNNNVYLVGLVRGLIKSIYVKL